ncbi:MAG TPA: hypothetical protein VGN26_12090 [Armatimonadota bacterium]
MSDEAVEALKRQARERAYKEDRDVTFRELALEAARSGVDGTKQPAEVSEYTPTNNLMGVLPYCPPVAADHPHIRYGVDGAHLKWSVSTPECEGRGS